MNAVKSQPFVNPSPELELEALAANLVGLNPVDRAQNRLKRAMLVEALCRTRGNYARAADLLGVRRQAIQQMVARYELRDWARTLHR
jgi:DNA-binding NtrC family response regulator